MEEVLLIPVALHHAKPMAVLFSNPAVTRYLSDDIPLPYDIGHALSFFETILEKQSNGQGVYRSIAVNGRFAGYVGVNFDFQAHACTATLGYWLGEPYFGRGIAPQAIAQMVALVFTKHPDIARIQCAIKADNQASRRAAQKAGFSHEATLRNSVLHEGKPHDECLYALLREEYEQQVDVGSTNARKSECPHTPASK